MQFESLSVMVVPPLLGLMLLLLFVLLVLVVDCEEDDVVTVAMPGATGGFAEDDDKDGRIFCTDGSRLSVNVTDVVVLVLLVLLLVLGKRADFDDDDGDKTSSCVSEMTILGSCVLMMVDDEGGLRCGILLLEQQSVKEKVAVAQLCVTGEW